MNHSSQPTAQSLPAERAGLAEIRRQAGLLDEQPLLRRALDALPTMVLILNRQCQAVLINAAACQELGIDDEQTSLGQGPCELFECIYAQDTAGGCGGTDFCRLCGAARAIQSSWLGEPCVQEWRLQSSRNGLRHSRELCVTASPFAVGSENLTLLAVEDIGAAKRRRALERVFMHDVLNIAGVVRGAARLLPGTDGDFAAQLVEMIDRSSNQLLDEITAQQQLISAERGELQPAYGDVESGQLLEQVATLYRNHPLGERCHLHIDKAAERVAFISDPALLARVVGNMVKNALEASHRGETVTLGCDMESEIVEFWVHNPAVIPDDVQLQVFSRSFSTKGSGRGLGTYSMKLFGEWYLGGQVSFDSSPDDGTRFWINLPLFPTID